MNYSSVLIYTTLSLISGIILGGAFLYFPFSVSLLLAISLILLPFLGKGKRLKYLTIWFIVILSATYYLFSVTDIPEDHVSNFIQEEVVLKGKIHSPPERGSDRVTFYISVEEVYFDGRPRATSGNVRLSGDVKEEIQYGDVILVRTKLKRPRGYHNPGGYDFEEALARDRVFAVGWVKERDITTLGFEGNTILRRVYEGRDDIRRAIERSLKDESSFILQSMVIGEEKGLTDEVRDAFMASGTTHILSISGSHLGLLAFLIYNIVRLSILRLPSGLLLRITMYTSPSKIAALSTIPPVILYTIIAGGQVATIRSLIMILVYLFAVLIEREERIINSLSFAALIILILNPQALFDVSFQLSYGSILSIGYILDWWKGRKKGDVVISGLEEKGILPKMKKRLTQYLLVAVAATLGTAPLVAYYFNQFSWVGLFSNIIVIPLAGAVIVPLGLFSGFLTIITGSQTLPVAHIIDKAVFIFYSLVKAFSKIPHASVHLPSPSIPLIGLYYLFLYGLLEWKRNKWMRTACVIASLLIILFTIPYFIDKKDNLKVSFIDVGQGDSSLIEFPDGKRMLIDGGGTFDKRFDIGRRVLAPYLWDNGMKRIDYIVLSHPHPDHLGGLFYIIENFRIGEVWVNGDSSLEGYQKFLRILEGKGIPVIAVRRGDAILDGDYIIYVLHPYPEFYPGSPRGDFSDQNSRSIVLKVVYKNRSLLFPGDIEEEAEEDLVYTGEWLKADVIKVPHHGGRTSSTEGFLYMVGPDAGVVSAGRDNIFHHPHKETIERYERAGVRIYRTDLDGAVIVKSDGNELEVKTFETLSLKKVFLRGDVSVNSLWDMERRNIRILNRMALVLISQ